MPALLLVILGAIIVFAPLIEKVLGVIGLIIGVIGLLFCAYIAFLVLSFLFKSFCEPYLEKRSNERKRQQRQREQEWKERQEEQEEEQKRKDVKWNYFLASIQNQEYGSAYSMIQGNSEYSFDQTQEFHEMEELLKTNSEEVFSLLSSGDYSRALSFLIPLKETPFEHAQLLEPVQHYVKLNELTVLMKSLNFKSQTR